MGAEELADARAVVTVSDFNLAYLRYTFGAGVTDGALRMNGERPV